MAPRGRPRKAGNMRIDAAIAKVSRLGYETPLIRRTVNKLLKVYDGEWVFIEDDNYKVVVETLLDDQEEELKLLTYNEEDKDSSSDGAGPSNAHDDAGTSDAYDVRDAARLPHAEGWKDISCMDRDRPQCREIVTAYEENDGEENKVRGLEANALQGAVGLLLPCRRKPCYGFIGSDSSDEEPDLVFFETEASRRKEMSRKVNYPKGCKRSRWDMQERP